MKKRLKSRYLSNGLTSLDYLQLKTGLLVTQLHRLLKGILSWYLELNLLKEANCQRVQNQKDQKDLKDQKDPKGLKDQNLVGK
jgi:hypothetical protein